MNALIRILCASLLLGSAARAADRPVWELTPCRVGVVVDVARDATLTPAWQTDWQQAVSTRLSGQKGDAWRIHIAAAPASMRPFVDEATSAATPPAFEPRLLAQLPTEVDKLLLLSVAPAATGYTVKSRELDLATRAWSTATTCLAADAEKLPDAAAWALLEVAAPVAQVAFVQGDEMVLRIRGSQFAANPSANDAIRKGDIFRPYLRLQPSDAGEAKLVCVSWTFALVEHIARDEVRCRLVTGLADPLKLQQRRGVERLAIRVRPSRNPTELRLVGQTDPRAPLAGLEVHAQPPAAGPLVLLGRTDLGGTISLKPATPPLQVVYIRGDGPLLARLPVVPGVDASLTAEIAANDRTLQAEAYIASLRDDLSDTLARRQTLLARAKACAAARQTTELEPLLDRLRKLPDANATFDEFVRRRGPAPTEAQSQFDAFAGEARALLAAQVEASVLDALTAKPESPKPELPAPN